MTRFNLLGVSKKTISVTIIFIAILFLLYFIIPNLLCLIAKSDNNKEVIILNSGVMRKTKIIATIGPSSSSPEMINKLIRRGVNIFRINMSHSTHKFYLDIVNIIKTQSTMLNESVQILLDLQGTKFRIGEFQNHSVDLVEDKQFILDLNENLGDVNRVNFKYPEIFSLLSKGDVVILGDGAIKLEILRTSNDSIETLIRYGGKATDKMGVNFPEVIIHNSKLTNKDMDDLLFCITTKPDFIALSFVNSKNDIERLRNELGKFGYQGAKIIAKIETAEGLANIEEITDASDLIMIARGDLSVNIFPENLFAAQEKLTMIAKKYEKQTILATQIMESMKENNRPTNAEIIDLSFAIVRGIDMILLSGETAAGKHPDLVVNTVDSIIRSVEDYVDENCVDSLSPVK